MNLSVLMLVGREVGFYVGSVTNLEIVSLLLFFAEISWVICIVKVYDYVWDP